MRIPVLISLAALVSTPALAQTARPLTAADIRSAIVGNTISGTEGGESYSEYLGRDGTISGRSPSGRYSGRWSIAGSELCFTYDEDRRGAKRDCSRVKLRGSQIIWDDNTVATLARSGPATSGLASARARR